MPRLTEGVSVQLPTERSVRTKVETVQAHCRWSSQFSVFGDLQATQVLLDMKNSESQLTTGEAGMLTVRMGCPPLSETIPSNHSVPSTHNSTRPQMESAYWHSNAGLVCLSLGRVNIADLHFSLSVHLNMRRQDSKCLKQLPALQLNRGLGYLSAGRGHDAYRCLRHACYAFGDRPALWLRLAEACVAKCITPNCIAGAAKSGHPRVVLVRRAVLYGDVHDCQHRCSLMRASVFARHALRLERDGSHGMPPSATGRVGRQFYSDLAASATLVLAFIHLELRDVAVALEWAEALLAWPRCEGVTIEQEDLARMYASEARAAIGHHVL